MNQEEKKIDFLLLLKLVFKKVFWNKYFFIVVIFVVWMVFFDTHSMLNHNDLATQIENYKIEKEKMIEKLSQSSEKFEKLKNNTEERERYARENYFMKRDNEDIIIVTYKEDSLLK